MWVPPIVAYVGPFTVKTRRQGKRIYTVDTANCDNRMCYWRRFKSLGHPVLCTSNKPNEEYCGQERGTQVLRLMYRNFAGEVHIAGRSL